MNTNRYREHAIEKMTVEFEVNIACAIKDDALERTFVKAVIQARGPNIAKFRPAM